MKTDGVYPSSIGSNVFYRVHVTHVSTLVRRSSSGGRGCACACACACAGGGRAGCTAKDFYNTNLKLSQLRRKAGK